jgi:hypothetical protein
MRCKCMQNGVDVFIFHQLIHSVQEAIFSRHDAMASEHSDLDGVERLDSTYGGMVGSTFNHPEFVTLGEYELIKEIMIDENKVMIFRASEAGDAGSIVSRGSPSQLLDEAKQFLHNTLFMLMTISFNIYTCLTGNKFKGLRSVLFENNNKTRRSKQLTMPEEEKIINLIAIMDTSPEHGNDANDGYFEPKLTRKSGTTKSTYMVKIIGCQCDAGLPANIKGHVQCEYKQGTSRTFTYLHKDVRTLENIQIELRHDLVQRILSLPYDQQKCLSSKIKYGKHTVSKECIPMPQVKGTPEIEVSNRLRRLVSDVNNLPSSWCTPVRTKRLPNSLSNESRKRDLGRSTIQDSDLAIKLLRLDMRVRRKVTKSESSSLQTMEETVVSHGKKIDQVKCEMYMLQYTQDRELMAQRRLIKLKEKWDLVPNAKEKLVETKEKFHKYHECLKKLEDMREYLKWKEDTDHVHVSKCLSLKVEIKYLALLRHKLENYKVQAMDVKLVEFQKDLKHLLVLKAIQCKVTSDNKADIYLLINEGIHEPKQVVMEELLRQRNENGQLHEFAEKHSEDDVKHLEGRLNNFNQPSDQFRVQYLASNQQVKKTIEHTKEGEEQIKEDLDEWVAKFDDITVQWNKLQREIKMTKVKVDSTCIRMKEAKDIEETVLEKENKDIAAGSMKRLQRWHLTKEDLSRTFEMLIKSQSSEKDLFCELKNSETSLSKQQ